MRSIRKRIQKTQAPSPCLFYPAIVKSGQSIAAVLSDAGAQAEILTAIARETPAAMVIRMTELWCEAASFGMACTFPENGFPALGEPLFTDAEELEDVTLPPTQNDVTRPLIEAVRKAAPQMEKPLVVGITGPYTLGAVLNGSEDFMVNCMTEDELVHGFLTKLTAFLIEYAKAYKAAGAAAVLIAEPSIAMISPAMAEVFSCAYIDRIIGAVQDENFSVIYHNCGAVNAHLPAIARLDADGFHFGSDVDLEKALSVIDGDRLVMGSVDPQLFLRADASLVGKSAAALVETLGDKEHWLLSTGCDLAPTASEAAIDAFFAAGG